MPWELLSDRPIYAQLVEQLRIRIVSGSYPPGGKLPSVRDLATEAEVNPNTMQKALSELEQRGLVFTQRTSGRFITEDRSMIEQVKTELATEQLSSFLKSMNQLGYTNEQTMQFIEKMITETK